MDVRGPKGPGLEWAERTLPWARGQLAIALEILDNPGGGLVFATQTMGQVKAAFQEREPERLSFEEEVQMRRHPADGYDMVRNLDWPDEVLQVVRHHHERWDGRGYPDRLEGTMIPLAARIVAVADALDAMTSQRPYRLALTFPQAHQAIRGGGSTQCDPAVVRAFVQSSRRLRSMIEAEDRTLPVLLRSVG